MRAGKENGILLPSVPGTSGQYLSSNGNGTVSWSTLNALTTDTAQTITGQKTFAAPTTYYGSTGQASKISAIGNSLVFEQTGATYGTTRMTITNESGSNGVIFEQAGTEDLVDFGFKTTSGQGNVRYERRPTYILSGNTAFEFQLGTAGAASLVVGDNNVTVKAGLPLKVGTATVYHTANIPGSSGDVMYNNAAGLGNATQFEVENGYLKIDTGLPASSLAGGTIIGAKDLAGRIIPAYVGQYGLDTTLQSHMGRNRIASLSPVSNIAAPTLSGISTATAQTAAAKQPASTNFYASLPRYSLPGTAGVGSVAGWRTAQTQWWRGSFANGGGFHYTHTFGLSAAAASANGRAFIGLIGSNAAPVGTAEPTTFVNCIGLVRLNASTTWQMYGAPATATSTTFDTTLPIATTTTAVDVLRLTMFCPSNSTFINWRLENLTAGTNNSGTITATTSLPLNTTFMCASSWMSTGSVSGTAGFDTFNFYIETDT